MKETLVKYLAGLLDADGSLSLEKHAGYDDKVRVSLKLCLTSADSIDRHGFVASLPALTGLGSTSRKYDKYTTWSVGHRADLERLLPRIIKHMVIKGRYWQWLLEWWRDWRSQDKGQKCLSADDWHVLQEKSRELRRTMVGPVRAKNRPTWAWTAGYLDGDGCFSFRTSKNKNTRVSVSAHINDVCGLELLQRSFGGTMRPNSAKPHIMVWWRGLGPRNASFALRFLPKLVKHSRLKKHQIEQMISYHRQRLSIPSSTEQATV